MGPVPPAKAAMNRPRLVMGSQSRPNGATPLFCRFRKKNRPVAANATVINIWEMKRSGRRPNLSTARAAKIDASC